MRNAGFALAVKESSNTNIDSIKSQLGVKPAWRSCHTAVSKVGGLVFEGHVPAKEIRRFLHERPEGAIGLAVPEMPVGTPGMEDGQRFDPYDVLLMKRDGSATVYAHFDEQQQQY